MKPSKRVRELVMARDGQCIACDEIAPLEFQHRQAVGAGGSKFAPVVEQGVAACPMHNSRFESDLQLEALVYGWKVKRWVRYAGDVPVLYWSSRQWCLLRVDGSREYISAIRARERMGGIYGDEIYCEWVDELRRGSPFFDGNNSCQWLAFK